MADTTDESSDCRDLFLRHGRRLELNRDFDKLFRSIARDVPICPAKVLRNPPEFLRYDVTFTHFSVDAGPAGVSEEIRPVGPWANARLIIGARW